VKVIVENKVALFSGHGVVIMMFRLCDFNAFTLWWHLTVMNKRFTYLLTNLISYLFIKIANILPVFPDEYNTLRRLETAEATCTNTT